MGDGSGSNPTIDEGSVLWEPRGDRLDDTHLGQYQTWLRSNLGLDLGNYSSLFQWSISHPETFWRSLIDFFDIRLEGSVDRVLSSHQMPGCRWFPDATINYAEHALRIASGHAAVIYRDETDNRPELSFDELRERVARAQIGLRRIGVEPGDRVVGYLPNCPEALIAFLASASLGAIWSSCPPEFGVDSVLDRFRQIEPKVLIGTDGYRYGGKWFNRGDHLQSIEAALPTLVQTVVLERGADPLSFENSITWTALLDEGGTLEFEPVPFEHPLWILYSSGTTGIPKAIVHGHGGIVLEHYKQLALQSNLGPGDRFFWYSTTGWMMWNFLVGGLLVGSTVVLYEGSPGYPDLDQLFRLSEQEGLTYLGTSAPFIMACLKAGSTPKESFDLSTLEAVGSTGAPLPVEGFEWVYRHVEPDLLLASISGGTDVCTAFVGSCPILPVRAGEIQAPGLGTDVAAYDESGRAVVDQVGELVVRQPMPSMPVCFWNDRDGSRYRESYFERFDGVWCHGDWIKIDDCGRSVIYGRSDSTLNRGGVRMGSSEFYRVIDTLPEVVDSLVVDTGSLGKEDRLWLFVVLEDGVSLDDDLTLRIRELLKTRLSPRHTPDEIRQIPAVPATLSGKKLEVPIKRILTGTPIDQAVNPGTLANPEALESLIAIFRAET